MYKMCKTEQSAIRQRELEQGLLEAMKESRYEDISISDLCQRIGIPRKAFYRYFSGKEGALHALIDHTMMDFEAIQWPRASGSRQSYQKDLELLFEFWKDQKPLLDALHGSGLSGLLIERAVGQALTDAGISKHYTSQLLPEFRGHAMAFCVTGLMSMVVSWHHEGYPSTPKDMARIAFKLLSEPLFAEASGK